MANPPSPVDNETSFQIEQTVDEFTSCTERHIQWKICDKLQQTSCSIIDLYHNTFWGGRIIKLNNEIIIEDKKGHFFDKGSTYLLIKIQPVDISCYVMISPGQRIEKSFVYELMPATPILVSPEEEGVPPAISKFTSFNPDLRAPLLAPPSL